MKAADRTPGTHTIEHRLITKHKGTHKGKQPKRSTERNLEQNSGGKLEKVKNTTQQTQAERTNKNRVPLAVADGFPGFPGVGIRFLLLLASRSNNKTVLRAEQRNLVTCHERPRATHRTTHHHTLVLFTENRKIAFPSFSHTRGTPRRYCPPGKPAPHPCHQTEMLLSSPLLVRRNCICSHCRAGGTAAIRKIQFANPTSDFPFVFFAFAFGRSSRFAAYPREPATQPATQPPRRSMLWKAGSIAYKPRTAHHEKQHGE